MAHEVGQKLRLRSHVGYDPKLAVSDAALHRPGILDTSGFHPSTHHPILAGQVGTVIGHSPAGEPGAGQHDEHVTVVQFAHHDLDFSDPLNPTGTPHPTVTRNVSFTDDEIDELFDVTGD